MILIGVLGGCRRKNNACYQEEIERDRQFVLHVAGIECEECAQLAVAKLNALEGVRSVTFVKGEDDSFEHGSLVVTHAQDISLERINTTLKREGFEIE